MLNIDKTSLKNNYYLISTVKTPQEILRWSLEDREKFVKSMKNGNISVYNGRGMVIGCVRAGKTTLVKKLKGERNPNTESTSGIEVHSHLFKLHENESTITGIFSPDLFMFLIYIIHTKDT